MQRRWQGVGRVVMQRALATKLLVPAHRLTQHPPHPHPPHLHPPHPHPPHLTHTHLTSHLHPSLSRSDASGDDSDLSDVPDAGEMDDGSSASEPSSDHAKRKRGPGRKRGRQDSFTETSDSDISNRKNSHAASLEARRSRLGPHKKKSSLTPCSAIQLKRDVKARRLTN